MPNWQNQNDYAFVAKCRPELIAWEFLRRNPEYQQDYHWFITLWNELETKYGSPPNRNFNAWKNDPQAYRSEKNIKNIKENNSIEDDLLIECWMGTKWGFYKFPLDPTFDNPIPGKDLSWRSEPVTVKLYNKESVLDITKSILENKTVIVFDLQKDLKQQIQSARQQLIVAQKNNLTLRQGVENFIPCLRILDAIHKKESDISIQKILGLTKNEYSNLKSHAINLMTEKYKDIIT